MAESDSVGTGRHQDLSNYNMDLKILNNGKTLKTLSNVAVH